MTEIPAQLSWSSFPFCRLATATSRGETSHLHTVYGVHFRHYGRNVHEYMLLGWEPGSAWLVRVIIAMLLKMRQKVKSVNFTLPVPDELPTLPGPTEWRLPGGWPDPRQGTGRAAQAARRACRGVKVLAASRQRLDQERAQLIFDSWLTWAKTRHFMVFKGVYQRWLNLWFEALSGIKNTYLYILYDENWEPVGLFGGEIDPATREMVVTLAKHTEDLSAKALWILGLQSAIRDHSPSMIHCGADADELKRQLGCVPHRSWVPDIKRVGEGL